jgi:hypothetical protein
MYGEPGYSSNKPFVLLGNYNPSDFDKPGRFGRTINLLERIAECEWSDEWTTCPTCGKLYRTQADCYSWVRSYYEYKDGEIECEDCINPEDYIEDLLNDTQRAITLNINPEDYGFEKFNGAYENGWYPGQNDNPMTIAEQIQDKGWTEFTK